LGGHCLWHADAGSHYQPARIAKIAKEAAHRKLRVNALSVYLFLGERSDSDLSLIQVEVENGYVFA
jgi:hypothetical protein